MSELARAMRLKLRLLVLQAAVTAAKHSAVCSIQKVSVCAPSGSCAPTGRSSTKCMPLWRGGQFINDHQHHSTIHTQRWCTAAITTHVAVCTSPCNEVLGDAGDVLEQCVCAGGPVLNGPTAATIKLKQLACVG